jgi:protein involved in polysaccharide export with SLBB domain
MDEISVSILGNSDLEIKTVISEHDERSLSLIGRIKISGLNQVEAQSTLEAKYSNSYLKSPWISFNIIKQVVKYVTVLEHFQSQGIVEFESHLGLTLIYTIDKANRPTLKDDLSKIILTCIHNNG